MRKVVVALVVALLALTLTGCGGGGTTNTQTTTTPPATTAAPPAASTEPTYSADRSADDSKVAPAPFPSFTTTITPTVFTDKLKAKRPMLIFFYDDAQDVTTDARAEVDAVMNDYRGLIDLITFNVGGSETDPAVLAAVTYARELRVSSTPYILVVDRGGYIVWRCKGYTERGVIKREVERATR